MNSLTLQDTSTLIFQNTDTALYPPSINKSTKSENSMLNDTLAYEDATTLSSEQNMTREIQKPSILTSHSLAVKDVEPVNHNIVNYDWITVHLIISLSLIAWVQIFYQKRLKQVFKSFIGVRYLNQLSREGNIFRERISIPLLIIYLISISLLIYLTMTDILDMSIKDFSGLKLFSIIMVFVLVSWFIKNATINIIGNIFKNYLILSDYILTNFIFNVVTGLILIPVLIISIYLSSLEALYSGIILWVLLFVYRLLRELFTTLSYTNFSLFNRFLYLCTLEIIPILVLTKLVMRF